jgi:CubicO group peptidase (beta-lactamase class C family)
MRRIRWLLGGLVGLAMIALGAWSITIGPVAVWRVLNHGTTTVWDHLEYPGRELSPSTSPDSWPLAADPMSPPEVVVEGAAVPLVSLLADRDTLALLVLANGELAYEWYAPGHRSDTSVMVFSVTKSIFSLLLGAAIDDGWVGSAADPVTLWVPELRDRGFEALTLEDLLRMDSNLDYVEDDNPFGVHVEFNYTSDLAGAILALRVRDEPDAEFRYKSGDNALLGLVLDRALGEKTITEYLWERLWNPLGAEHSGMWSTDREGGLERTWCCLALTARDLARFGQLVLNQGEWGGQQVLSASWLEASFQPSYDTGRWPEDYDDSPVVNYGYQWWLTEDAWVALGKGGQYLYVDPVRHVVIVRLGETQGDLGWVDILRQIAETAG